MNTSIIVHIFIPRDWYKYRYIFFQNKLFSRNDDETS